MVDENQASLSEQIKEDDMKVNVKKTNQINNKNDSESFLSDQ